MQPICYLHLVQKHKTPHFHALQAKYVIRMGFVDLNFYGATGGSLCKNQAPSMTIPVKFPANSFSSTPQVLLSITHHDVGVGSKGVGAYAPTPFTGAEYRLDVHPLQISSDGFDVSANTWVDACLWDVGVQWLAILEY
jgi:hypothetical protein